MLLRRSPASLNGAAATTSGFALFFLVTLATGFDRLAGFALGAENAEEVMSKTSAQQYARMVGSFDRIAAQGNILFVYAGRFFEGDRAYLRTPRIELAAASARISKSRWPSSGVAVAGVPK